MQLHLNCEPTSIELLSAFRNGDQNAATILFERYKTRLLAMATTRMSLRLQQRLDPEDLYQSACMIFIDGVRHGRFRLRQSGDLWSLLLTLTINRLRNRVGHHTTAMRSLYREDTLHEEMDLFAETPSPEDAAILVDEVQIFLNNVSNPRHRLVIELALEGHTAKEIAGRTNYSQERVRQIIKHVTDRRIVSPPESAMQVHPCCEG